MKQLNNIMNIFCRIGYIGLGIFICAAVEYGVNIWTMLGIFAPICIVILTRVVIYNEVAVEDETI